MPFHHWSVYHHHCHCHFHHLPFACPALGDLKLTQTWICLRCCLPFVLLFVAMSPITILHAQRTTMFAYAALMPPKRRAFVFVWGGHYCRHAVARHEICFLIRHVYDWCWERERWTEYVAEQGWRNDEMSMKAWMSSTQYAAQSEFTMSYDILHVERWFEHFTPFIIIYTIYLRKFINVVVIISSSREKERKWKTIIHERTRRRDDASQNAAKEKLMFCGARSICAMKTARACACARAPSKMLTRGNAMRGKWKRKRRGARDRERFPSRRVRAKFCRARKIKERNSSARENAKPPCHHLYARYAA